MRLDSVIKKLNHFKSVMPESNTFCFYSRANNSKRYVKVVEQENGNCIALPMIDQKVVFHATTIKSLVEFLKEN